MTIRFAVISDTHFLAPGNSWQDSAWWNKVLNTRSEEIGTSLVETIQALGPDFVVHCGDFTGHGDLENFAFGYQIMEQMRCPWYAVPGNHDTWFPGIRKALATHYHLPEQRCYFSLELPDLRLIFLDVAYWTARQGNTTPYLDKALYDKGEILGMGPEAAELDWLADELDRRTDLPTVLVSHIPLGFKATYPAKTMPRGQPTAGPETSLVDLMGDMVRREQVRSLLHSYPNVKAAFAGHWHIHDVTNEDGIVFCQTAALREYPFEIRMVTKEAHELRVSTHGLNEPRFRELSYVPDWGNRWVEGTAADREFTISL